MFRWSFFGALLLPFVAKTLYGAGVAGRFLYPSNAQEIGAGVAFLLSGATLVVVVLYLIRGRYLKGLFVLGSGLLALWLPKVDFDAEYILFKKNREAYLAAVASDLSPSPKFMTFALREIAGFPAGSDFYEIVYDETGQLGRPQAERTPEWKEKHGVRFQAQNGKVNPPLSRLEVRSFGDNFFLVVERF